MIIVIFNKLSIFSKCFSMFGCKNRKFSKLQFEDYETYDTMRDDGTTASDGINTEEDALGQRLVEQEYANFTNGLRVGIALSRYFAESNNKPGWVGRLLKRSDKESEENKAAIADRFKSWFQIKTPQQKSEKNAYEPLRLQETTSGVGSSQHSGVSEEGGGRRSNHSSAAKSKVSKDLDDIFRTLQ